MSGRVGRRHVAGATLFSLGLGLALCCTALARPIVIEESAQITNPDPLHPFREEFAVDGNDLFVCGGGVLGDSDNQEVLFHYVRQPDGSWLYRGVLVSDFADYPWDCKVAVRNGVGAFVTGRSNTHLLERTTAGWSATRVAAGNVQDVAVLERTVAIGSTRGANSVVRLYEKPAGGNWTNTVTLDGPRGFSDDDFLGAYLETSQQTITAGHYSEDDSGNSSYLTYVFDGLGRNWTRTGILDSFVHGSIVIDEQLALNFGRGRRIGELAMFYSRSAAGAWTVPHGLQTDEWFGDKRPGPITLEHSRLQATAYAGSPSDDARGNNAGSVNVFTRSRSDAPDLVHAATLLASDGQAGTALGHALATSGWRAVARTVGAPDPQTGERAPKLYVFDLPGYVQTGSRLQDTFEDMDAAGWSPWGTTNWRVVASDGSHVFRQSNVQGDARAIFEDFTNPDHSIQADLKVNAFGNTTQNCWVGLMARYADSQNFYYLMNGRDTLQIRKMANGVYGPIATTPFTLQVGRNYRFRLEAIGTRIRAYVDDKLMLDVRDSTLTYGRAGLTMWKADAQFDNVVLSTGPNATMHADTFSNTPDEQTTPWTLAPANAWQRTTSAGATIMRQSSIAGDARAVQGAYTEDQIITAEIRPRSFHSEGTGFVGLMARYLTDDDYYYVLLTKSGKASLRRWWGRKITILEEVPMPVTLNTSYRVRFEVIGNQLRFYVNGRLMAEAQDDTFHAGRYGMVTYRGAADFDNFRASRP